MAEDMRIQDADMRHVRDLAACHGRAFPGEFLTLLGPSFLRRFYGYYICAGEGIVKIAVDGHDSIVGCVCGGEPKLHGDFSRRYVPVYALRILAAAVRYRLVRKRLFFHAANLCNRIVRTPQKKASRGLYPPGQWSSLLSIGVDPAARGQGVGKQLMEAFCEETRRRGCRQMRLSVHLDNDAAVALYRKAGWQEVFRNDNGIYFVKVIQDEL